MISGISGSEDPHNSLVFPDIAVFLRFPFKWVLSRFFSPESYGTPVAVSAPL
jgi:hypothetical protein